ncbi:hypothetical protein ZYGR_0A03550 [Zygosaccharomyces rouxii]|uniref:Outer spore wall protein 5 n=2 Tax=Zygosaccharomyces rouxii TaxID=4956 RepID=OSW5_ZYGRC|nr:uncharacterized protein ZYRO0A08096g [Zygosaccharomyces rouxii]C5DQ25.1 RecName: Full=Outer spore wall protein 5 [Zygosaccharomyces rouxii CBS 732]KAH9198694.1 outer spore wall protein 5 [Zygosaccharomyces rouxii]GAV46760.1 hypothetical protein ZYGR_0A03550 [Zygosaccharomyces rouxii]CAR25786.1 ZYRO0A08096p [Zygosaccharomyces rouxii]
MATLSSVYFLIYFVSFLAIAAVASFFIIPLLGISFLFASAVVVFGFLSDITFKFAQSLYIKTDHRLKSTLSKMGNQKKGTNNSQAGNSPPPTPQPSVEPQLGPNANVWDAPGAETSTTSAIARSLEAREDVRVTN